MFRTSSLRAGLALAAAMLMPGASLATRRTVTNDAIERAAFRSMRQPRSRHLTLGDHVALQAAADKRARKAAARAARGR